MFEPTLRAGVVFVDRQAEIAEIAADGVRDCALVPGRTRERCKLGEEVDDLGCHRAILSGGCADRRTLPRAFERGAHELTEKRCGPRGP